MGIDVNKMKQVVEGLKEDLGDGFMSCDIWSAADGQPIVGFNPHPKAAALFNEVARFLKKVLKESLNTGMGNFYVLDLGPGCFSMTIFAGEYQLGMLLDSNKVTMGLLMNVAYPRALQGLQEAVK